MEWLLQGGPLSQRRDLHVSADHVAEFSDHIKDLFILDIPGIFSKHIGGNCLCKGFVYMNVQAPDHVAGKTHKSNDLTRFLNMGFIQVPLAIRSVSAL